MLTSLTRFSPARPAGEAQPSRRLANKLMEEDPCPPGPQWESARPALLYVLGLLGLFIGATALVLVLNPTAGEHLSILFGLCSSMLGALAVWILLQRAVERREH